MSSGTKVLASRMALTQTKGKLKGAQNGHKLLKKKSDALTVRYAGACVVVCRRLQCLC